MTKHVKWMAMALCAGLAVPAAAQPQPAAKDVVTPLKVQVVLSRYQGEKKVSSMFVTRYVVSGRVTVFDRSLEARVTS